MTAGFAGRLIRAAMPPLLRTSPVTVPRLRAVLRKRPMEWERRWHTDTDTRPWPIAVRGLRRSHNLPENRAEPQDERERTLSVPARRAGSPCQGLPKGTQAAECQLAPQFHVLVSKRYASSRPITGVSPISCHFGDMSSQSRLTCTER